jgi:hypothetical protein
MKSLSPRSFIAGSAICMAFAALNGAALAESLGYQCRAAVRAERKGPDCRMALPPLARLATAIYLLTPRSRLWTIKLMSASSGVVRDDKQKTDHDAGLDAAN